MGPSRLGILALVSATFPAFGQAQPAASTPGSLRSHCGNPTAAGATCIATSLVYSAERSDAIGQFTLPASPVVGAEKHYLFAYFKGNGEDGMHLAHSTDGLR